MSYGGRIGFNRATAACYRSAPGLSSLAVARPRKDFAVTPIGDLDRAGVLCEAESERGSHGKERQEQSGRRRVAVALGRDSKPPKQAKLKAQKKADYNKALADFQVELVKLQKWIQTKGLKVVVIFEGRDAAGKGGAIKRITQSLNPRVCRVEALAKPTERERTQWYFQRYVGHLPAAGEMVCFDRSWYNRAGVEQRHGLLHRARVQGVSPLVPGVRAHAGPVGDHFDQILVLRQR